MTEPWVNYPTPLAVGFHSNLEPVSINIDVGWARIITLEMLMLSFVDLGHLTVNWDLLLVV